MWDYREVAVELGGGTGGVRGDRVLGEAFGEAFIRGYLNVNEVHIFCVDFVLERTGWLWTFV